MTFNFDKAIEKALLTWYPEDHKLHFDPHHPLGKLLGEWGEFLDCYMKMLYKPEYKFDVEDELGDVWYYLRILCYQKDYVPNNNFGQSKFNVDYLVAYAMLKATILFKRLCSQNEVEISTLSDWRSAIDTSYIGILEICHRNDITLQQLTESNWEKLKPGSERGGQWAKARTVSST